MSKIFFYIIVLLVVSLFCCFQVINMAIFGNYCHAFYLGHHFGFHQNYNGLFVGFSIVASFFFWAGYFITKFIEFFSKNILGIFGIILSGYTLFVFFKNLEIERKYKREINNNDDKYIALRCENDSCCDEVVSKIKETENLVKKEINTGKETKNEIIREVKTEKEPKDKRISGWDHIYLVEKGEGKKKFHRIVNRYTLDRLGYPRPIREDPIKERSRFDKKGYILGEEIRIVDLVSIISDIKEYIKG